MKTAWETSDVGQFFVTGPTDVATKPSHFYCRICRKDVSVLTHGHHEILRHFHGSKHFPRDQRLRLETPGWEVLDYEGNIMSPAEVEHQREKIVRALLVVRDREYPFSEDVIVDETGAVDPNLGVMAKVPSLIEVLRLGGSYELVYRLWAQFTLSAVRVNVDVTWWSDEVLVSSYSFAPYILRGLCASSVLPVLVHHPEWDISTNSVSLFQLGQIARGLYCGVWGRRWQGAGVSSHLGCGNLQKSLRCIAGWLQQRSSSGNFSIGSDGGCIGASVASISGGSTVLVEDFCEYLGSGYRQKLIDYPVFDLRLFRRCLQRTASSVFGSLDGLAMTVFIVNRLKRAETRDWMSSRPALKKAILTNDLSMPHLVDVVANIIGVWPLIVSYLKETGRKDDSDSLVVRSPSFWSCWCTFLTRINCAVLCFRRRELTGTFIWTKRREWSSACCIFFLKSVSSLIYCCLVCFAGGT